MTLMARPLIAISYKQALLFASYFVLYEFLTYIANDMILPGMVHVIQIFHAPESAIASSLTAYMLGGASLQLLLGPLSDSYGRRPVMLFGAAFFVLCTLIISMTTSMPQFLVVRFFQGMGMCFICVVGYATLHEMFSDKDAIRLTSIMANIAIIAPLIGPLAGAIFVHYWSWRLIFVLIGILASWALWGLWRWMPEPIGQTKHDGTVIHPISFDIKNILTHYLALCTNKNFMIYAFAFGLLGSPCVIWIGLAPVILMRGDHLTLIQYGLWQLPVFAASITGNIILQQLIKHYSVMKMIWIGSSLAVISLLFLAILPGYFGQHFIWLMPGLICYFLGYALAAGPLYRHILMLTSVGKGMASALNSMMFMLIQAGCLEIANLIYIQHNNFKLGLFCASIGLVYFLIILINLNWGKKNANKK